MQGAFHQACVECFAIELHTYFVNSHGQPSLVRRDFMTTLFAIKSSSVIPYRVSVAPLNLTDTTLNVGVSMMSAKYFIGSLMR